MQRKEAFSIEYQKMKNLKNFDLVIYPGQTLKQYCRVCSEHFEGGKKTYPD